MYTIIPICQDWCKWSKIEAIVKEPPALINGRFYHEDHEDFVVFVVKNLVQTHLALMYDRGIRIENRAKF